MTDTEMSLEQARRALQQRLQSLASAGIQQLPRSVATASTIQLPPAESTAAAESTAPAEPTSAAPEQAPDVEAPRPAKPATAKPVETPAAPLFKPPAQAETQSLTLPQRVEQLHLLREQVAACTACDALAKSRTQTVFGTGSPDARLCFLGEAPGADEDRTGEPFVGAAGKMLTDIIEKGMKLSRSDVYILNILKCRPPGNRTPQVAEARNCRGFLHRQLELIRPDFICCLGRSAATHLLGLDIAVGKMRGNFYSCDYPGGNAQAMVTYHPSYLIRQRDPARIKSEKRKVWDDIQMLMQAMGMKT